MPFCAVGKQFFTDSESDYVASAAIYGDKMGAGCSGGPWVDDSGVVAGVNSYTRWSRNHTVLDGGGSPILDEKFESLYKYVLTLI